MKIYMDLHTHTISCGHAYSTLKENIEAAQARGLKYLGLSEHAPAVKGAPPRSFFINYNCLPRQFGELRLFCGAEANIMDYDGTLDLDDEALSRMDYVIASLHSSCLKFGTLEENMRATLAAMENPHVNIIGHPDDSRFPLDYEELVKASGRTGTVLEFNNSSLTHPSRKGVKENVLTYLKYCKQYDVPIVLGTDSHFYTAVGNFENAIAVLREADFPEELVLNANPENINKLVNVE